MHEQLRDTWTNAPDYREAFPKCEVRAFDVLEGAAAERRRRTRGSGHPNLHVCLASAESIPLPAFPSRIGRK